MGFTWDLWDEINKYPLKVAGWNSWYLLLKSTDIDGT